jgi:hypothetical protein
MAEDHHYDKFVVQSLVGNASWSSMTRGGKYFHVGTIPDRRNHTFVSDLRMMVAGSHDGGGFRPVACYARRARKQLVRNLADHPDITSWEMLGTNLSVKLEEDVNDVKPHWTTETGRLLLMDRKDFNILGLGVDDLIDAYVQTVLSVIAIDRLCEKLMIERTSVTDIEVPFHEAELTATMPNTSSRIHPNYEPRRYPNVEVIEVIERDGVKYVKQRVTQVEQQFDFALFEALNPDIALLQEISH